MTTNVETSQRLKVESGDWSKTEQIMIGKSKKTEELLMCLVTYKESEQKTKKLHSSTGILQTSYSSLQCFSHQSHTPGSPQTRPCMSLVLHTKELTVKNFACTRTVEHPPTSIPGYAPSMYLFHRNCTCCSGSLTVLINVSSSLGASVSALFDSTGCA